MWPRSLVLCALAPVAAASLVGGGESAAGRAASDCEGERPRAPDVVERRCGPPTSEALTSHLVARDLALHARVPDGCSLAIELRRAEGAAAARVAVDASGARVEGGPSVPSASGRVSVELSGEVLEIASETRARFAPVADRTGRVHVDADGRCHDARLVFERIGR